MQNQRLREKVVLITGGGTGIGRVTAELFAAHGARVVVTGLDYEPLKMVVAAIEAQGGQALAIQQDVTIEDTWDSVIKQVLAKFGQLDILINNAGIAITGNVENTSLDDWNTTQSVNLTGVFLGTRAAVKAMKGHGGSIINISSIEGIIGEPMAAAYNASKGGVRIFTKSAALHCAQQGYNIRVNSVHPGFINTDMTSKNIVDQIGEEAAELLMTGVLNKIPMGRVAEPSEIATGLLFLASDDSSYMTGAELVLDGGYTAC